MGEDNVRMYVISTLYFTEKWSAGSLWNYWNFDHLKYQSFKKKN